eukprot:Lankesteria_metandrocarpae@DN5312_c0_g1_i5.p1
MLLEKLDFLKQAITEETGIDASKLSDAAVLSAANDLPNVTVRGKALWKAQLKGLPRPPTPTEEWPTLPDAAAPHAAGPPQHKQAQHLLKIRKQAEVAVELSWTHKRFATTSNQDDILHNSVEKDTTSKQRSINSGEDASTRVTSKQSADNNENLIKNAPSSSSQSPLSFSTQTADRQLRSLTKATHVEGAGTQSRVRGRSSMKSKVKQCRHAVHSHAVHSPRVQYAPDETKVYHQRYNRRVDPQTYVVDGLHEQQMMCSPQRIHSSDASDEHYYDNNDNRCGEHLHSQLLSCHIPLCNYW